MDTKNLHLSIFPPVLVGLFMAMSPGTGFSVVRENAELLEKAQRSVVSIRSFYLKEHKVYSRIGTGFIWGKGIIVTRKNVVENTDSISVTLTDGRSIPAVRVGQDAKTDVVLLRIRCEDVPSLGEGRSNQLPLYASLTILGNSMGIFPSVTLGTYAGRRTDGLLEINCLVPPGNSGGPVLNASGELVGMVIGRVHREQGGENREAISGIALPVEAVDDAAKRLLANAENGSGWIGVSVVDLEAPFAGRGVRVIRIVPDGPTHQAGISVGDTLVQLNGCAIPSAADVARKVRKTEPNSWVSFSVQKGKKFMLKQIKVDCLR